MHDEAATDQPTRDEQLRTILEELSAGRLMVGEAFDQVKALEQTATVDTLTPMLNAMKSRRKSGGIIAGFMMLLLGGLVAGLGAFFGYKSVRLEMQGHRTEGHVIRMLHGRGDNKGSKPVVAYMVNGKAYEVEGSISASPPAYKQGEKATVYYNPTDPSDAQIGGFVERWLFPTIFGGIGGLVFIVGMAMFFGGILRKLFGSPLNTTYLEGARFTVG